MKIAKIKEHSIETSNLWGKQKQEAQLFIIIFMLLSNRGIKQNKNWNDVVRE